MSILSTLKNTSRPKKRVQRIGRGEGSGRGKTSGKGNKGYKSRAGYKSRLGREGGQLPLFQKMPVRGFTRGRFVKERLALNFSLINALFQDGETVNAESLRKKGYAPHHLAGGIKILVKGALEKRVTIEAHSFSAAAKKKLDELSIPYKIVSAS